MDLRGAYLSGQVEYFSSEEEAYLEPDVITEDFMLDLFHFTMHEIHRSFFSGSDLSNTSFENAKLNHAVLASADLSGANLKSADLRYSILTEAVFHGANLEFAILNDLDLVDQDFGNAHLHYAYLMGCQCVHTDFSGADLTFVRFYGASLRHANFSNARLDRVNFDATLIKKSNFANAELNGIRLIDSHLVDVDFSKAKSLSVSPGGSPCSVDLDTINNMAGNVPAQFWQDINLPKKWQKMIANWETVLG